VLGLQALAPGGEWRCLGPQRVPLGQHRRPLAGQRIGPRRGHRHQAVRSGAAAVGMRAGLLDRASERVGVCPRRSPVELDQR